VAADAWRQQASERIAAKTNFLIAAILPCGIMQSCGCSERRQGAIMRVGIILWILCIPALWITLNLRGLW
jgi:hypothetical protein